MTSDVSSSPAVKLSLPLVRSAVPLASHHPLTRSQEYQQDLFNELRADDALVVLARGLGLLRIVTNLLHSYDAAGNNLIVVVGAEPRENRWIGEALAEHAAVSQSSLARGLTVVNTDVTNVGLREKAYARGGIFSVTTRILVVDVLSKLLDPAAITGLVFLHAERVSATSGEAFVARVFRQANKTGFLMAFSDSPEPYISGFAPLATNLRNLFLRKPSLWPRFHVTVAKSLEGRRKAEVIEFDVPLTDAMRDIQNAILECVEVSLSELRKTGTGVELDDWAVDSALHRDFAAAVRRQLEPVWHRTNARTRQIVFDLGVLRDILFALVTNDAVAFNQYLDTVRAAHQPQPGSTKQTESPWLFLDAADTLFDTARRRVYIGKPSGAHGTKTVGADTLTPVLEEQPKWAVLAEILEEIERDAYFNPTVRDDSNGTILVMCSDQNTCRQLREYLETMHVKPSTPEGEEGKEKDENKLLASFMMRRKLSRYLEWKKRFSRVNTSLFSENQKALEGYTDQRGNRGGYAGRAPPNKRRRVRGGGAAGTNGRPTDGAPGFQDSDLQVLGLSEEVQQLEFASGARDAPILDDLAEMEDYFALLDVNDLVVVHAYDGDADEQLLEELRPRYVITYEPDAAFVRRVEVYRSSHTERNVRVYFMYYGGSVEEQRYLSAVRKEKDAFAKLIKERSAMALTLAHDGAVADPAEAFLRTVNTRIAGGGRLAATAAPPRVVVDVREFRSSLPSLLHGRNLIVIPCTLAVADYVLSPGICVERKSVRDLISSFRTGRLFHQAETMLQYYAHPMLLIEFDQNKAFTLDPFADHASSTSSGSLINTTNPTDVQSKIVLLTLAFPRLKVIWSSSPYQTAEIFEELKKHQDEPDPIKAVRVGLDVGDEEGARSFNSTPQDMLRAVPGVTGNNMSRITLEVEDLVAVSNLGEKELDRMVGREAGRKIHGFFNKSVVDD